MKIRQLLLPTGLGVALVLSLVLSGMMWANPAHSNGNSGTKVTKTSDNTSNATFQDIYLPSYIISTSKTGKQQTLTNNRINIVSQLRDKMSRFKSTGTTSISQGSSSKYLKQLHRKNSLLLNYETSMTVNFFRKVFQNQLKIPNMRFNRVQLLLNDPKHLYLLNDKNYHIERVTLKGNNSSKLKKVLADQMVKHEVDIKLLNGKPLVYYPKAVKLKNYSFQLTQQTETYYANRIMTSNNSNSVQVKRRKNKTEYNDRGFRQMTVDKSSDTVTFTNYNSKSGSGSFLSTMNHAYQQMVMVGIPMDSIRLFYYDSGNDTTIFRTYVGGVPVFDQSGFGAVRFSTLDQTSYRMYFSLDSLQVPIPPERSTTTLISMKTLLTELKNAGIKQSKITNIKLGYEWSRATDMKRAVNLSPTWYVLINHQWETYTDAINGD